jgi:flagellar biosynthesis/type III secretory pathway protein FliH
MEQRGSMSFTVFHDLGGPAIATPRRVIKAADRQSFADAIDMLQSVRALKDEVEADIAVRSATAAEEGRQSGYAAVTDIVSNAIKDFAIQIAAFEAERREEIASAAYAAVRAIIGDLDGEALARGLVTASLARIEGEAPLVLELSATMAERIAPDFADRSNLTIRANEMLGAHDCHLLSAQGRIIADLNVQLDTLAKRWGVEP